MKIYTVKSKKNGQWITEKIEATPAQLQQALDAQIFWKMGGELIRAPFKIDFSPGLWIHGKGSQ